MATETTNHDEIPQFMPDFAQFYRAINHNDPFPWQQRLAEQVSVSNQWPAEVGIPTGLGKTACLDIAVWWLASQAHLLPPLRTVPTRIWWVVNRRLLVDSTTEHAISIADKLRKPNNTDLSDKDRKVITTIASRLRSLAADPSAPPLDVIRLRGGIASRTPRDPSQPTIVLCTLPMYGSRLLFRGYGSSHRMRPIDAAMAGTDSLVLLDEAHLAPHLKTLVSALFECYPDAMSIPNATRSKPRITALTATGDAPDEQRFTLDDKDAAHSIVQTRLDAAKPLELRVETGDSAKVLADVTLGIIRDVRVPSAYLVFANTPKTARNTFDRLRKQLLNSEAEVLLLTGLTREREAERIRARILDLEHGLSATRKLGINRQRNLIVVATQTLEVGADIDAEYLVTEACGVRALTQRLGRLNRLGRYAHARAVYIHLPPPKRSRRSRTNDTQPHWPVYGTESATVLERLQRACRDSCNGVVDLSPRHVTNVLGVPLDKPHRAPEVLPGILWEWIKTTIPCADEAPVEPYFSGITGTQYKVSLIWRAHVPESNDRLWPRATDRETIDIPIEEARNVLKEKEIDFRRIKHDGVTVEIIPVDNLRPGDQIVLPSDCGLLDEFGWQPEASGPVVDTSLAHHGLPLDAKAIKRLCGLALVVPIKTAVGICDDDEDVDPQEQTEAVEEILNAIRAAATPPGWDQEEWRTFTSMLTPKIVPAQKEVYRLRAVKFDLEPLNADFDETSLASDTAAIELYPHCHEVGIRARAIAYRTGLASNVADIVERAGCLHDTGKADRRFQRWLDPNRQHGVLVAKSHAPRHLWESMRIAAGWPYGGRHENLSARLVKAWLVSHPTWSDSILRDLLLHLVISHHGKGRPLVPPVSDDTADTVSAKVDGTPVTVPANLKITDWDQPARFRRLNDYFGPWGLALLESIVIRSDHAISGGATSGRKVSWRSM